MLTIFSLEHFFHAIFQLDPDRRREYYCFELFLDLYPGDRGGHRLNARDVVLLRFMSREETNRCLGRKCPSYVTERLAQLY